jgi:hypothetical protein
MKKIKVIAIIYFVAGLCFIIAAILQYQQGARLHFYMNLIVTILFFIGAFRIYIIYKKNMAGK